jgi:hypothetical protein
MYMASEIEVRGLDENHDCGSFLTTLTDEPTSRVSNSPEKYCEDLQAKFSRSQASWVHKNALSYSMTWLLKAHLLALVFYKYFNDFMLRVFLRWLNQSFSWLKQWTGSYDGLT